MEQHRQNDRSLALSKLLEEFECYFLPVLAETRRGISKYLSDKKDDREARLRAALVEAANDDPLAAYQLYRFATANKIGEWLPKTIEDALSKAGTDNFFQHCVATTTLEEYLKAPSIRILSASGVEYPPSILKVAKAKIETLKTQSSAIENKLPAYTNGIAGILMCLFVPDGVLRAEALMTNTGRPLYECQLEVIGFSENELSLALSESN